MADPNVLLNEVSCLNCNSNASMAQLLELALLQRIDASGGGGGGGTPALPLNSVQFNNAGAFGGSADLTFNDATNVLALNGDISLTAAASQIQFTDSTLVREAANVLGLRNGVNGQELRLYRTFTSAAIYERGFVKWNGAVFEFGTEAAGGGGNRAIQFRTSGLARWRVDVSGELVAALDNTYDIGLSGASRPRNLFLSGGITTGATTLHTTSAALANGAGAAAGTLGNAPTAGDPAKWISIVDNGTTRYIPTWI